jgi:hypothetical protein
MPTRLIVILMALALFGCTSMQAGNYSQIIRVTTDQPGAVIRHKGKILGITPALIEVRRSRKPVLVVGYPNQDAVQVVVPTRYRWAGSLLANLVFSSLAPVGWMTDFLTGTAWDLKEVTKAKVPGSAPREVNDKLIIAVAPVIAEDRALSDELGRHLEKSLRQNAKYRNYKVLSYDDSLNHFEDFEFNFENPLPQKPPLELFVDLNNTHVAVAESEVKGDDYTLNYKLVDVRTDQVEKAPPYRVGASELSSLKAPWSVQFKYWLADLIPNTVTADAANDRTAVYLADRDPLYGDVKPSKGWLGDVSRFLGNFSVTNLLPPRSYPVIDFHFRFTPLLTFAYHDIHIDDPAAYLDKTDFHLSRLSYGLGPEIAIESALGVFYVDLIPGAAYSWLAWSSPVDGGNASRVDLALSVGLGYYRYFTNRIAVRVFFRQTTENSKLWNEGLDSSQGFDVPVESVSQLVGGFSLCYYFPDFGRQFRR